MKLLEQAPLRNFSTNTDITSVMCHHIYLVLSNAFTCFRVNAFVTLAVYLC